MTVIVYSIEMCYNNYIIVFFLFDYIYIFDWYLQFFCMFLPLTWFFKFHISTFQFSSQNMDWKCLFLYVEVRFTIIDTQLCSHQLLLNFNFFFCSLATYVVGCSCFFINVLPSRFLLLFFYLHVVKITLYMSLLLSRSIMKQIVKKYNC